MLRVGALQGWRDPGVRMATFCVAAAHITSVIGDSPLPRGLCSRHSLSLGASCDKAPQTPQLSNKCLYFLPVLEAGSPRSRCQQGGVLLRAGDRLFQASRPVPGDPGSPWPVDGRLFPGVLTGVPPCCLLAISGVPWPTSASACTRRPSWVRVRPNVRFHKDTGILDEGPPR